MDNSVRPTIEKIKLQEQDNEIRLKEKREINAAILTLNRNIHETTSNIEKLTKEYQTLIVITDKLEQQLIIERIRQTALLEQVEVTRKECEALQKSSMSGVTQVWDKRSRLFENVHYIADKCDIWALLIKPTIDVKPTEIPKQNIEQVVRDDSKLKAAIERRNKAIVVRNFLLSEPDVGEEFVRTRNALQYSMEIMANEQNN